VVNTHPVWGQHASGRGSTRIRSGVNTHPVGGRLVGVLRSALGRLDRLRPYIESVAAALLSRATARAFLRARIRARRPRGRGMGGRSAATSFTSVRALKASYFAWELSAVAFRFSHWGAEGVSSSAYPLRVSCRRSHCGFYIERRWLYRPSRGSCRRSLFGFHIGVRRSYHPPLTSCA